MYQMMDPVPSCPDSDHSAEAPSNPSDKDVVREHYVGIPICLLTPSQPPSSMVP